jgi:hypothetical protein
MRAAPLLTILQVAMALLSGCAAARSSAAAPRPAPDCSFRSASTCWTMAARFPAPREAAAPDPDDIVRPSPTRMAMRTDSVPRP